MGLYESEFQVDAQTDDAVGAGETVGYTVGILGLIVVIIEGLEVGSVHLHLVRNLIAEAEAYGVGADIEGDVVHAGILEVIFRALHTGAHLQFLADVIFGTEEVLVAVAQHVLGILLGVHIEKVVPSGIDAQ